MNVDKEQARHLATLLERIRDGERDNAHGICTNIMLLLNPWDPCVYDKLEQAASMWPGRYTGPDAGRFYVGGEHEYRREQRERTMWDNPRRLAVLDWLIDYFKRAEG